MKQFALALAVLILAGNSLPAIPAGLSEEAKMSLLTATPGQELYAAFGHSALWVYDPANGIDEVYNWGTFDFNTPNFYMKFLQGRLLYKLSVVPLHLFLLEYEHGGRGVYEQVLNLTHAEMRNIYAFLQYNRRPENRYYLYDFFYDNCATRIRDLADEHLMIDWGPDPHPHEARTFRDMVKPCVEHRPWIEFGIDILLGVPADKKATPWHYMFLPDEMFIAFQHARHSDGRLLVNAYNEILQERGTEDTGGFPISPLPLFWVLCIGGVAACIRRKICAVAGTVFFSLLGLTGLLVFFMWFLSDHQATAMNLNILWALPTHLYFAFRRSTSSAGTLTILYFRIVFVAMAVLLLFWPLNPQTFHGAFFPIILLAAALAFIRGFIPNRIHKV